MRKRRRLVGKKDRELLLREKLMDLGNLVLVGLFVGQILNPKFNFFAGIFGIVVTVSIYFWSYLL